MVLMSEGFVLGKPSMTKTGLISTGEDGKSLELEPQDVSLGFVHIWCYSQK
jgi:hypothetical protein